MLVRLKMATFWLLSNYGWRNQNQRDSDVVKESEDRREGSFLLDHSDENLKRSLRNIKDVGFLLWKDLNTYQLINNDNVIVSKKGFDSLCKNMKLLNTR